MSVSLSLMRFFLSPAAFGLLPMAAALAGPADVRPLQARTGPAPFAYTNAPDVLPNYVAGAKWGTQADPIRTMQLPMDPADSAKRMVVQPGFSVSLWASEPEIVKPIAMAWDARGRLWIAETRDYPNELQEPGRGRDRIRIVEDTNADGRADRFTVFAEDLSIPTSLCFANGGVVVLERGQTLFLADTNGDDRADERRVLFRGWGMGDTHATASNLRPGLDQWIWGTVGYSGFDGEVGGRRLKFGMGVFRFKSDGSALEFIRSSNNNTWGLGITEDGTILGSTANRNSAWYMAMPNRFYEAVRGWSAGRMEPVADSEAIYPITEKVRQVDQHHHYTAGAGSAIYTARAFPEEFWNRVSFVAEPTGHLLGWFRMERKGADYRAVNLGSFLASDDEWTAPIIAEVGPDGALWVVDWYNYIVQHNPVPAGFQNGKGNAYETVLRDKRHGRIYRVTHTQGTPTRTPQLAGATPADWVAALRTDNQLWRLHAQRLLVERGQPDVAPALRTLVADPAVDAVGLNVGAIHALWTLQGLKAVGPEAVTALRHPSAAVRRAAVSVLPRTLESAQALIAAGALRDADGQVRLAALLALAET
ncbi:MAG: glycosyl hydrolase, partial [Verrucomicrobia bacterium]|nr:glycosyl hydrolase [Verrucomicrobiota bacterium]